MPHTTDLAAEYADQCRRTTSTAYRVAVLLDEEYSPSNAPRNNDRIERLKRAEELLAELAQYLGLPLP